MSRFNPKCLYADTPPPIECYLLQEVVTDRDRFIALLVKKRKHFGVQKCETLLLEIGTPAFTRCAKRKRSFFYHD